MKHILRPTGKLHTRPNGINSPVYTTDGWYRYDVHEGDTVIINNGSTSSMYILKGYLKCEECPLRANNGHCKIVVKCQETGMILTVCRALFGLHPIDEILENL